MNTATKLLRRVDDLELQVGRAIDEIRAFLAAEPEAEPVAWQDLTDDEVWEISKQNADDYEYFRAIEERLKEKNHPPNPAEPAARKPMTEEKIEELCDRREFDQLQGGMSEAFYLGIRFAEKHHGILEEP